MAVAAPRRRPRIFYGWWIVLATAVLNAYSGGVWFYGFGAFFKPIVDEFGWSYAVTALAFSLYRLEAGAMAPLIGYLVDRLGPRKLIFLGTSVIGAGFIALGQIDSLLTFYAAFIFISVGYGAASYLPGITAIANWFVRKRGTAMGFLLAGYGASGMLVPGLVRLINEHGWRNTMTMIGIGMWIVGIPAALVIRHRPETYGYLPDGDTVPAEGQDASGHLLEEVGVTLSTSTNQEEYTTREALRTSSFWLFSVGVSLGAMGVSALVVHEIPYLVGVGMSAETAALAITMMTLFSIGGRLGFAYLGDRFDRRYLLIIAYSLQLIGILVFAYVSEVWHLIPFVLIFGPAYGGAVPLRPALQADYFGIRAFATIQGFMQLVMMVPGMLGPVLAGWIYDVMGSYRMAFIIFAAVTLAGLPLIFLARPPLKRRVTSLSTGGIST